MKHTLIELKTGIKFEFDDTIEKERKEYYKKVLGNKYMEWFVND